MQLPNITQRRYDIGKAVILAFSKDNGQTFGEWDMSMSLFDNMYFPDAGTESPIQIESNAEFSDLTIEDTGPAILKRYLAGESPSFDLSVYATPAAMRFFSPTGTASAGFTRRPLIKGKTIWVVPEQLFISYNDAGVPTDTHVITYAGDGVFLKDGEALSDEDQDNVEMSILVWKAQPTRLTPNLTSEEGGNSLAQVTIQMLQDFTKPNGCQLYLHLSELEDIIYTHDLDLDGSGS